MFQLVLIVHLKQSGDVKALDFLCFKHTPFFYPLFLKHFLSLTGFTGRIPYLSFIASVTRSIASTASVSVTVTGSVFLWDFGSLSGGGRSVVISVLSQLQASVASFLKAKSNKVGIRRFIFFKPRRHNVLTRKFFTSNFRPLKPHFHQQVADWSKLANCKL